MKTSTNFSSSPSSQEHAVFENSLLKLQGVCEVRSLFQLNRSVFWSFNIVRPVKVGLWLGGKEGEGAKLLLDFKVEYQVSFSLSLFIFFCYTPLIYYLRIFLFYKIGG